MPVTTRRTSAALAVADVWQLVVGGTWAAADTVTLTVGVRTITITLGATVTTAAVANAIVAAWNGDDVSSDESRTETGDNVPEFAEASAAIGATASTVLITMKNAGVPLGFSANKTSTSGTVTVTHPTAATGPRFWSNAGNWDNGVPADGDTIYLDGLDVPIEFDLDQSSVQPAALYIDLSFTGNIGLPEQNDAGGYPEYRDRYLKIGAAIVKLGRGSGNGSGLVRIDTGTDQCALTVYASGNPTGDLPAVLWKGTHASNALVQTGGDVGVAFLGGETATIATINKSGGSLVCGNGATLSGALTHSGGTLEVNSAITTSLTQYAGDSVINGTGAVAQLKVRGGTCAYNTTGTLGGNTVVSGAGVLDFSQNPVAKTVTNPIDLYGTACQVLDPLKVVSALVVDGNEGADPGTQVVWGTDYRLTRAATA